MTQEAIADYWYRRSKELIQNRCTDKDIPISLKDSMSAYYNQINHENAESMFNKIKSLESQYNAVQETKFYHGVLRFSVHLAVAGISLALLSHVIALKTKKGETINKWSHFGRFAGLGLLFLGCSLPVAGALRL